MIFKCMLGTRADLTRFRFVKCTISAEVGISVHHHSSRKKPVLVVVVVVVAVDLR